MRLRDHTSGGPLGLVSVSVANWSTRIPRRAPESHIHWTESRGTLTTVKVGRLTRVPVSAVAQFVSRGVAGACVDTPMPSSPAEREADRRAARTNEHVQGSLFDDAAPVVVRAAGVSLSRRARRPSGRSQG